MMFKKILLMFCAIMIVTFSGGWFWNTEKKYFEMTPKEFISLYNEQLNNLAKIDGKDYSNFEITGIKETKKEIYTYSLKDAPLFVGIVGVNEDDNLAAVTAGAVGDDIYPVAMAVVQAIPKSAQIPNIKEKLTKAIDTVPKSAFAQSNIISENGVQINITYSDGQYIVLVVDEKALEKSRK